MIEACLDRLKLAATYAYSYPVILPIDNRAVRKGEVLNLKIRSTICGGMKTLKYAVTWTARATIGPCLAVRSSATGFPESRRWRDGGYVRLRQ